MTAIAIFVKTPGHSALKTRLAAEVGLEPAERWHRAAAQTVARLALKADVGPVYWAVAETDAMDHPDWQNLPRLNQGSGGLGERMGRIHASLVEAHGSGLLLGADTVQWQPDWLRDAARWLEAGQARMCLGRARDGGFWTFGGNRRLDERRWRLPRYSQSDTAEQFMAATAECGAWLDLPVLTDLDYASDIDAVRAELDALPSREEEHNEIMRLLITLEKFFKSEPGTHRTPNATVDGPA